jgi:Generalcontrol nonderepressible 1 (Gcn1) N-terminal
LHTRKPIGTASLIAKEMDNVRPVIRRAFCSVAGDALWECGELQTKEYLAFAAETLPSFEINLKNASANPTSSTGPLEGYIALALFLGPYSRSHKFGTY